MGVPYNQLLVTLLQSFGLTSAEYEQPGLPGYGFYHGGSGVDSPAYAMTEAKKRAPLFSSLKS
jgi:hypothetical protein